MIDGTSKGRIVAQALRRLVTLLRILAPIDRCFIIISIIYHDNSKQNDNDNDNDGRSPLP
jgi:hypothetical protein